VTQGQVARVTVRVRKLLGTLALVAMTLAYMVLAGAIYASWLGGQAWWVLIIYFAGAGLLWFFPAALIIGWMSKPDA